jgi:hypothetical protein
MQQLVCVDAPDRQVAVAAYTTTGTQGILSAVGSKTIE